MLAPLRDRRFALLWVGQAISFLGDRTYGIALPFLIFEQGGTASQISLAFTCFSIAQVVFLLVGGVLVDRWPRRLVMLTADGVRALILVILVGLLLTDRFALWHIYVVSAGFGFFSAFFMPAAASIVPELVKPERLVAANALRSLSMDLSQIVGPLLGSALVAVAGVTLAMGFDAASFLVSAACVFAIGSGRRAAPRSSASERERSYLQDIADGFRYVAASQWLWVTITIFALANVFLMGTLNIALPVLAAERLGGAGGLGTVLAAMAAGSILSALIVGRFDRLRHRGILAYGAVLLSGVVIGALGLSSGLLSAAALAAVLGAGVAVFGVIWEATLQERVPTEALGRVVSIDMLGSFALLPVGYLLVGALIPAVGLTGTMLIGGIGTVALAVCGLSLRAIRSLD